MEEILVTVDEEAGCVTTLPEGVSVTGLDFSVYIQKFPWTVKMPCGNSWTLASPDDFHWGENIPCPCGNPNDWFVKFRFVDQGKESHIDPTAESQLA